ncbi:MAG: DUF167 domain-containing protein [Patescibacteria group bacterium]
MYISVRVLAGAKKESVEEVRAGRLRVAVKEPAKQNLANRRVLALVAAHFGIAVNKVRLVSGHTSPSKIFSVDL